MFGKKYMFLTSNTHLFFITENVHQTCLDTQKYVREMAKMLKTMYLKNNGDISVFKPRGDLPLPLKTLDELNGFNEQLERSEETKSLFVSLPYRENIYALIFLNCCRFIM